MKNLILLFIFFLFGLINAEEIVIYSTESAQYSANDCCTLNSITNQNSDILYSQDCQDMGNYGCGMSKQIPLWSFDLSSLDSTININSVQLSGNIIEQNWSDVYLSMSSMTGSISTNLASNLWAGGDDWVSGINWSQGNFSQNLPVDITLESVSSGQLNILAFTSNPWQIFSIDNSGDDAPRLIIEYENIEENCSVGEVELWGGCYNIEETTNITLYGNPVTGILDLGVIPSQIGDLINLDTLSCGFCGFTGSIPPEIGNLINLTYLNISFSGLTGSIPSEIGNLTNLNKLILHSNQLSGTIPPEIGNLINLFSLQLSDNQFTGTIPPEIGNLTNLTHLYLSNYWPGLLTGSIPPEIGNLINLERIDFSNNQLSGTIPPEIGNLINVLIMELSKNQLTGSIPPEIGNLANLNILSLNENSLTGELPPEIFSLTNLSGGYSSGAGPLSWTNGLDVSDNLLTGEISRDIGNLINMVSMDLSENQFTGTIPPEIGNLTNLWGLMLDSNQFYGPVPAELWDLSNHLEILDLSFNQFSGEIPGSICQSSIPYYIFDISNNQLCPLYPTCIEDYIGEQDTSNCEVVLIDYSNFIGEWYMEKSEFAFNVTVGSDQPIIYGSDTISLLANVETSLPFQDDLDPDEENIFYTFFSDSTGIEVSIYEEYGYEIADSNFSFSWFVTSDSIFLYEENPYFGEQIESAYEFIGDTLIFSRNEQFCELESFDECFEQYEFEEEDSVFASLSDLIDLYVSETKYLVPVNTVEVINNKNIIIPQLIKFHQNYPNPFNPVTSLSYDLPEDGLVNITIYDMMGRIVKTLVNSSQTAGFKSVQWNATNDRNEPVSAGLYLYTIQAGEFRQTKKMVLLK